jgi:hypothetical protein
MTVVVVAQARRLYFTWFLFPGGLAPGTAPDLDGPLFVTGEYVRMYVGGAPPQPRAHARSFLCISTCSEGGRMKHGGARPPTHPPSPLPSSASYFLIRLCAMLPEKLDFARRFAARAVGFAGFSLPLVPVCRVHVRRRRQRRRRVVAATAFWAVCLLQPGQRLHGLILCANRLGAWSWCWGCLRDWRESDCVRSWGWVDILYQLAALKSSPSPSVPLVLHAPSI